MDTETSANSKPWPGPLFAITIFADDLEAAKAFYQNVFGLPLTWADEASAVFTFGTTMINLLNSTEAEELIGPAKVAAADAGARSQITLQVDDVDAMCTKLQAKGVVLINGPMDRPWGYPHCRLRRSNRHDLGNRQMKSVTAIPAENAAILRYLTSERDHARDIISGLTETDLHQPVTPSGWSILGLIQHFALDMDRFWFRCVIAAEPEALAWQSTAGGNWAVGADVPSESVFAIWADEIARSNEILLATDLDAAPAWWPKTLFGDWRLDSNREVVLHVLAETSCHAGHLDIVRELIDGRQFMVLD